MKNGEIVADRVGGFFVMYFFLLAAVFIFKFAKS